MIRAERGIPGIAGVEGIGIEAERKLSVGVALAIVGVDPSRNGGNISSPLFWTIIEQRSNPLTEKVAGQISFPGETSKVGEGLEENILGAVAEEFSGDESKLGNLWYINGSSHMEGRVFISKRPADLVVLAYTGSLDDKNIPFALNEVTPNKWMTLEELLAQNPDRVRKFAREALVLEQQHGLIGQVVNAFMHDPLRRIPLSAFVPSTVSSMEQFYQTRRSRGDVVISNIPLSK